MPEFIKIRKYETTIHYQYYIKKGLTQASPLSFVIMLFASSDVYFSSFFSVAYNECKISLTHSVKIIVSVLSIHD